MARTMLEAEDEMTKLWTLVGELSEQLANNQALVAQLKAKSENVKGQAAHVGAGFPLRRFNLDISDEQFATELEAFSAHLVSENQQLQYENKQLNGLLKEYEATLETVMSKFRGVAHASQQHELSLHGYYTSLLQTLQTAHSTAHLHDDTSLSLLLTRLSGLLRGALRTMGGEDADVDLPALENLRLIDNNQPQPNGDGTANGQAQGSFQRPGSPSGSGGGSSGSGRRIPRQPDRPTPFAGSQPGATGGYSGTEGRGDWALEREMEILRLEAENQALREMLDISKEFPSPDPLHDALEADAGRKDDISPVPNPNDLGRRKSSLTVKELEAGAEKEAEERDLLEKSKARISELRDIDSLAGGQNQGVREGNTLGLGPSQNTGLGPHIGGGTGQGQMSRPQRIGFDQSLLMEGEGVPPEQVIDDSTSPTS